MSSKPALPCSVCPDSLSGSRSAARQMSLFPSDRAADASLITEGVGIKLDGFSLRHPRQWGGCWAVCQLWDALGLDNFWEPRMPASRKGTSWLDVLKVLCANRLLEPSSEWRVHREWFGRSAMADLLGCGAEVSAKDTLYRGLDKALPHKEALFQFLRERWADMFNASFDVLLYDLTSTYFESDPPFPEGDKRRHGYSRDHRPDCVQVVVALVVTPEGFPVAYEVMPGNTADCTTLRSFLDKIEGLYGKARRIWLMDRGIPTEATLEELRSRGGMYVVGTPKGRLTKLEEALAEKPWQQVRKSVRVKLLPAEKEVMVFVESGDRVCKERSMRRRRMKKLLKRLATLAAKPIAYEIAPKDRSRPGRGWPRCTLYRDLIALTSQERRLQNTRHLLVSYRPGHPAQRAPPRRPLPPALQPHRKRSWRSVGVLSQTR